jgi:hypothetical protein
MDNNNNQQDFKRKNDVFSTPEIEIDKGFFNNIIKWIKKYKKIIIPIALSALVIFVLYLLISSNKSKLFPPEINANYVKNYHSGLESNVESILLNFHNDIPVPDSVEFISDSIRFIRKDITEVLPKNKLYNQLSAMGFVYSIVIDLKSYKDLDIESWVYRANYNENEKNLIYAEYTVDFTYKNDVIDVKSLELNYEHFKTVEIPVEFPPKDTAKTLKEENEEIIADSTLKTDIDTSKNTKNKVEENLKTEEKNTDDKLIEKDGKDEKNKDIKSEEIDKDKPAKRDSVKK